ncbi:MAG: hypothetical protein M1838_005733 [Thelocarpon superellum]|nr:MAG: hypothetical protein M1838_005733 [Thelocarpon superellum]
MFRHYYAVFIVLAFGLVEALVMPWPASGATQAGPLDTKHPKIDASKPVAGDVTVGISFEISHGQGRLERLYREIPFQQKVTAESGSIPAHAVSVRMHHVQRNTHPASSQVPFQEAIDAVCVIHTRHTGNDARQADLHRLHGEKWREGFFWFRIGSGDVDLGNRHLASLECL